MYHDYKEYHKKLIKKLNHAINESNSEILLFGAHIFSQYLITNGLDTQAINCILDNDSTKHQKRLYGTTLKVKSPSILKNFANLVVILKAGIYNDEIKSDILANINDNCIFLE